MQIFEAFPDLLVSANLGAPVMDRAIDGTDFGGLGNCDQRRPSTRRSSVQFSAVQFSAVQFTAVQQHSAVI